MGHPVGVPLSDAHRAALSVAHTGVSRDGTFWSGPTNGQWKGTEVSYSALHAWVSRRAGKAREHSCSRASEECSGRMEWANVSGDYHRDLEDFMVLCATHHKRFDREA